MLELGLKLLTLPTNRLATRLIDFIDPRENKSSHGNHPSQPSTCNFGDPARSRAERGGKKEYIVAYNCSMDVQFLYFLYPLPSSFPTAPHTL